MENTLLIIAFCVLVIAAIRNNFRVSEVETQNEGLLEILNDHAFELAILKKKFAEAPELTKVEIKSSAPDFGKIMNDGIAQIMDIYKKSTVENEVITDDVQKNYLQTIEEQAQQIKDLTQAYNGLLDVVNEKNNTISLLNADNLILESRLKNKTA